MATLVVFNLSNPPSSLSISFLSPPTTSRFSLPKTQFSASSLPALDSRAWSPRLEIRSPAIAPANLRRKKALLLRLSCFESQVNPQAEMGMFYSLFQEMGFDVEEADKLSSVYRSLKFASHGLIRARVLVLLSLGLSRFQIHRLVLENPDVLIDEEIERLLCFVRADLGGKVDPFQLEGLLSSSLMMGFESKVRVLLDNGVSNSEEQIGRVLKNVNWVKAFCCKSVEEIEEMVSFLKPFNGPYLIVKYPKILHMDLDRQLALRIEVLLELSGGDVDATGKLLCKDPLILRCTGNHYKGHIEFLRSFAGLTNEQIFRIFQVYPSVISSNRERRLRPRIEFLKECRLSSQDIYKFLTRAPLFLSLSFRDNIGVKLAFLVKLGFKYRTKEVTVAIGSVCRTSCKHLQNVISTYLSFGLSLDDILVMSNKHPSVLQYGIPNLKKKMEYLTVEMGHDIRELLTFPTFLGYKLDDRIKRRHEVSKKAPGTGSALNYLLSVSSAKFSKKENQTPVELVDHSMELEEMEF